MVWAEVKDGRWTVFIFFPPPKTLGLAHLFSVIDQKDSPLTSQLYLLLIGLSFFSRKRILSFKIFYYMLSSSDKVSLADHPAAPPYRSCILQRCPTFLGLPQCPSRPQKPFFDVQRRFPNLDRYFTALTVSKACFRLSAPALCVFVPHLPVFRRSLNLLFPNFATPSRSQRPRFLVSMCLVIPK